MKKKSLISIVLFAILIASISCCKEKPPVEPEQEKLPELTHEGLNTFGCRVNGEVWVAKTPFSIGGPVPLHGTFDNNTGNLYMVATLKDLDSDIYEKVNYSAGGVNGLGTYNVKTKYAGGDPWRGYQKVNEINPCSVYYHDSLNPGTIIITHFDTVNYIISGTFEMDLINPDCKQSILKITEGRFDMRY